MSNIWFTSDLHMSHAKEFLYGPRNFSNEKEMNEAIVENWNSVVQAGDTVYNLGDMAMNDISSAIPYLNMLNGTQYWLLGNHDTDNKVERILKSCWKISVPSHTYAHIIKEGGMSIYMSHYPTLTANFDEKHFSRHVLSLHGHTHQTTNWLDLTNPFLYHVGLDSHDMKPVNLDEIIADIRNRWNELGNNTGMLNAANCYGIPKGVR
jgi:calcineurin-like phosphoesterase family protein